jgi:S-adenosylmethionine hydrolase
VSDSPDTVLQNDTALEHDTVTFLSDYGTVDEFAGLVRSVIHQVSPQARVVDLTHEIAPFDVRAGSLALARSVQYLCPGVILGVVDPGVGTDRRPVAIEVAAGRAVFVGPDNGLFAAAVGMIGGAERAVVLDNSDYHLDAPGPTFDGRDVFAPVAAHLCQGVSLDELGTAIDTATLMPGLFPLTQEEDGVLQAEVLWIDRFGNVQINVGPEDIDHFGNRIKVEIGGGSRVARRVQTFAEAAGADVGLIVDSYGLCALVADRGSAAELLACEAGDEVCLSKSEAADDAVASAVSLSPRERPGGEGARR